MTKLTLEDLRNNPALLDALHARARRERSEYVHGLLQASFAALRPQPRVALRTVTPCA